MENLKEKENEEKMKEEKQENRRAK